LIFENKAYVYDDARMRTETGIYRPNAQPAFDPVISVRKVSELTSLCRKSIYNFMEREDFPKPVRLSGKRIGWRLSAVNAWIETRQQR